MQKNREMYLRNILKEYDNIFIYEACPCSISKIKNVYRWQILIKGKLDLEVCSKNKKKGFMNYPKMFIMRLRLV